MRHTLLLLLLVCCLRVTPVVAQAPAPGHLTADTLHASAGGTLHGNAVILHGTLGQTSVTTSRSTLNAVTGGIWHGIDAVEVLVVEKAYRDVTPERTEVGETLTFIVATTNNGVRSQANIVVSDTLPVGLTLLPESVEADKGTITVRDNALTLHLAQLTYEEIAVLTYRATVDAGTEGQTLTNTAIAQSESYGPVSRSTTVHVYRPARIFLPLVLRGYPPPPPVIELEDAPDRCPGATIAVGTFYRDDFDAANDNDWFAFQVSAGQTYVLETGDLAAQADTLLALYAPGDCTTPLTENDDIHYPTQVASRIVWTAPAAGVYCALVRSYDWRIYGADTGYTLRVTTQDAATTPQSISPETDKPMPPPTPTPDSEAHSSRRAPGLAAPLCQKPTPPPTPVKPPVPPTPTAPTRLAPTPTATVTVPAILLPTTGTARWSGWVGLAALALADLGVLYAIRRRQA